MLVHIYIYIYTSFKSLLATIIVWFLGKQGFLSKCAMLWCCVTQEFDRRRFSQCLLHRHGLAVLGVQIWSTKRARIVCCFFPRRMTSCLLCFWRDHQQKLPLKNRKIPVTKPNKKTVNKTWRMNISRGPTIVEGELQHLNNENRDPACLGDLLGILLPSYIGIIINHYEDPGSLIMESKADFFFGAPVFVARLCNSNFPRVETFSQCLKLFFFGGDLLHVASWW